MKRAVSILLAMVFALTLFPGSAEAASSAYGSAVWLRDTPLQQGVTYSDNIFWSGDYDKPRHEYYFTYTPGIGSNLPSASGQAADPNPVQPDAAQPDGSQPDSGMDLSWLFQGQNQTASYGGYGTVYTGVRPVASYGNSVCGRSTVSEAAQKYESMGYRVVGGINGDFYDTATGYPLGILVSDGEVLSGSSEYYAVGFRADGSVVMGTPKMSIVASATGRSLKLASLNKPRVDKAGVTMLTSDYRDDHTTGSSVEKEGVNVLATVIGGRAEIGGELYLRVDQVVEDAQARTLAENQVLLTGASNGYDEGLGFLRSLTPGETVTISITTADPQWADVTEAVGAYYLLVENGVAKTDFEVSAAPRTAVGVKANGELVLYTLDGRQNSVSMGASLGVLAKRMVELGCVSALCLDGGGSTTAVAAMPDGTASKLLNSPSDSAQRKVTNHIMLLAPGGATGIPGGVYLSAGAPAVLAGHSVKLTANATDTNYYPMSLPLEFYATAGEVQNNTFIAPRQGGTVTVTASCNGLTAQRDILVLDAPSSMSIKADGASAATTMVGGKMQLTLTASYNHRSIEIFPEDVVWSIDPSLGTVDQTGLFTASQTPGSGSITATRGNVTASIPVTVEANHPFVDLSGHWAEPYMGQLYQQKVLTGEVGTDGQLYARPERGLSRAEFSVLLARYLKIDTSAYAGKATPFTDLEGVESWAGAAIRAMYDMGIVNGVSADRFAPSASLERSQAVTMLGRALGLTADSMPSPEIPAEPSPETPVTPDGSLPDGTSPDGTAPEEPAPEDVPPEWLGTTIPVLPDDTLALPETLAAADFFSYPDAGEVPEYAQLYFQILVAKGAVEARDGMLAPASAITRAEICKALVVMRNG